MSKELWEQYYFNDPNYFNQGIYYNLGFYSLIYVLSLWIHGTYRSFFKIGQIIRAIGVAVLVLLAIYALVNVEYRFSRALLLISGFWALIAAFISRLIKQYIQKGNFKIGQDTIKRIFIVGGKKEALHVKELLDKSVSEHEIIGCIAPVNLFDPEFHLSTWNKIETLAQLEKINEIIFCIKDLEWTEVINLMNKIGQEIEYKMVGDDKMSVLGSKSKNTSGELYTIHFQFTISKKQEQLKKRILDILLSSLFLLFSFILFWAQAYKKRYFSNLFSVLAGNTSFVSYDKKDKRVDELPVLKPGIISAVNKKIKDVDMIHRANLLYAKNYTVWKDVEIIFRNITSIGAND